MHDFVRTYQIEVPASVEAVWDFHSSAEALQVLTPSERRLTPITTDLTVTEGAIQEFRFVQFGVPMTWKARLHSVRAPYEFTDEAVKSPFSRWSHHHEFIRQSDSVTVIRDTVTYQPLGGLLSSLVNQAVVGKQLDALFAFRHRATLAYFTS